MSIDIGKIIQNGREKKGWTRQLLAKKLETETSTITNWENGKRKPSFNDVYKMVDILDILWDLFPHHKESKNYNNDKGNSIQLQIDKMNEKIENLKETVENFKCKKETFNSALLKPETKYRKVNSVNVTDKIQNMVLYFCQEDAGIYQTKLNRLLFYADFLHYRHYGENITNIQYIKGKFGIMPAEQREMMECMFELNMLTLKRQSGGLSPKIVSKETFRPVFKDSEAECIAYVMDYFKDMPPAEITNFSNQEMAFTQTPYSELVDYRWSDSLLISLPN